MSRTLASRDLPSSSPIYQRTREASFKQADKQTYRKEDGQAEEQGRARKEQKRKDRKNAAAAGFANSSFFLLPSDLRFF